MIGWGATKEGGKSSPILLQVDVPTLSTAECQAAYPDYAADISYQNICAAVPEGGKDTCQGDSGGPLFVRNEAGEEVLYGITSWGLGCARPGQPVIFLLFILYRVCIRESLNMPNGSKTHWQQTQPLRMLAVK